MRDAEEQVERLYELPLDEFTPARDQLAADLREQGQREAAAEVKKLRKPSVAAWTVNQLARRQRREVAELLSVGKDLRAAQTKALSGRGAEAIRDVTVRRRKAVDRLVDGAEELLADSGHGTSRATLDKVADTLTAATVDEEAADAVQAGRLTREFAPPSGFELLGEGVTAAPRAKPRPKPTEKVPDRVRRARERAEHAENEAEEAKREADRLEQEAERTRKAAERARRNADRAAERARDLRWKAKGLS
jgi:hypothetical protein